MELLLQFVEELINKLPPLLQLILGIFVTLGIFKVIVMVADYYDEKKSDNE